MAPGMPYRRYDELTVTQADLAELAEHRRAEEIMDQRGWGVGKDDDGYWPLQWFDDEDDFCHALKSVWRGDVLPTWALPRQAIIAADEWLRQQERKGA